MFTMVGCPKFQEIEINVTKSHHIRICRVLCSVATVQLSSTQLGFTDFAKHTVSKVKLSDGPGDWLYVTQLDSQLSHDLTYFKPYKEGKGIEI